MNNSELIEAMRPGSKNPLAERAPTDLGRFGLGLKTASFSQSRRVTVLSRKLTEVPVFWCWDFDYVARTGQWHLRRHLSKPALLDKFKTHATGTMVLWEDLDRLVGRPLQATQKDHELFLAATESVGRHLAMVFHRFLERGRLRLHLNEREIGAWDPFLRGAKGAQVVSEEQHHNGQLSLKGYVLPHKSWLSEAEFRAAAGPRGWNAQQGFYVYRNERLLVAGSWLGLFGKEEHHKLARIQVDITNESDAEWQIDVKKATARLPQSCTDPLRTYARQVRARAVEVYRHKGVSGPKTSGPDLQQLWREHYRHDKRHYEINREHPLVHAFVERHPTARADLYALLNFIGETVPVSTIMIRESETPEQQAQPFEGVAHDDLIQTARAMYRSLTGQGRSPEQAKHLIASIYPFNLYPQYLATLGE